MPLQTLTLELAAQIAADYPALQSLNLSSNALRDVHHLQLLPSSLTQLDLGGNRLSALPEELGTWLPNLRLLRLRANALESLRPVISCKLLHTLDIGANRVAFVSELRFLQPLAQLRHLSLDGNPLSDSPTYRREVLAMLPQLQTLDGQDITAAERLYAKLQLKTQLGGGGAVRASSPKNPTPSPLPSPTRLLTPDSLQTQRRADHDNAMSPVTTTWRVDVNGDIRDSRKWEEEEKETGRIHRVELHVLDDVRKQPSPFVLAAKEAPSPVMPTRFSTHKRPEEFRHAKGPDRRDFNKTRTKYADLQDVDYSQYQGVNGTGKDHSVGASDAETREMLLNSRVEALETILSVQDRTMRHTLARFGECNPGSRMSVAGRNGSVAMPTAEAAAAVYTRLLAAWREKCVALMVQAQSSKLVNEAQFHEYRRQETETSEELRRCEDKVEMWQQRAADFEAQRDLEVVATRQAEAQRAQANAKAVQAVRGMALEREKLQKLAETVVLFTGGLVRDKVEQLHSGSARLQAFERRLLYVKERIGLASTLVTHRETRLRNSEAALEAERRVWAHRLEQMRNLRLQNQETKNENGGDIANVAVRPPADGKILRPATETALRALFHRLDAYGAGLVRSQELVQALRRGDPGVLRAVGGPKKLSKLVSHVEAAIRRLSHGGGTLAWGEFLLFFIPESSVSIASLLEDNEGGGESELAESTRACSLCTAVKSSELPSWPFTSPVAQPTDQIEAKLLKKRKDRKALETLSHAELVQQNTVLLADRERLRGLLARDAHDLRDRVRSVRREWEAKTRELVRQKEKLQQELNDQAEALQNTQKQHEVAELARDETLLEIRRLREQLTTQEQEFELQKKKLEAENAERLQHEQDIWQTETQDARLAHSLLQSDHSKQQVRIRQLERDLARQKEALLAHETERVASLEEKVRRRDAELARQRRERNTILSSLREQEQKLATATKPTPTESIATQTEIPASKQRTVASQTKPIKPKDEALGGRMSINEISTLNGDRNADKKALLAATTATHLTPEDVNLRLQKLQSLTDSLLAD